MVSDIVYRKELDLLYTVRYAGSRRCDMALKKGPSDETIKKAMNRLKRELESPEMAFVLKNDIQTERLIWPQEHYCMNLGCERQMAKDEVVYFLGDGDGSRYCSQECLVRDGLRDKK